MIIDKKALLDNDEKKAPTNTEVAKNNKKPVVSKKKTNSSRSKPKEKKSQPKEKPKNIEQLLDEVLAESFADLKNKEVQIHHITSSNSKFFRRLITSLLIITTFASILNLIGMGMIHFAIYEARNPTTTEIQAKDTVQAVQAKNEGRD